MAETIWKFPLTADEGNAFSAISPLSVRRCWEAWSERERALINVGDPEGRLIEIRAHGKAALLVDRRLALRLAREIIAIAGPDEELPSDKRFEGVPLFTRDATLEARRG